MSGEHICNNMSLETSYIHTVIRNNESLNYKVAGTIAYSQLKI